MTARIAAASLIAAAAAFPAEAAQVAPYPNAAAVAPADENERRVWGQGEDFDELLRKSGRTLENEKLTGYLQQVMDRLFPEFQGRIRVRVIRSPHLNAFALPNGSIYINEGLLARFQNESQLATVLAHEGIHFVNRHGFQTMETVKNSAAIGTVISLIGVPVVGQMLALSSITGFSQELETEADNEGYKRVIAAGYDPRETPKTFKHLIDEIKAADVKEPFFFSSHPKLQDRLENYTRLSANASAPAAPGPDPYVDETAALRVRNLENDLSMGRYKQVLLVLDDAETAKNYPPHRDFYRGEAYRLRGDKEDEARAEAAYLKAIEAAPGFGRSYRALGIHYLKKGAYAEAQMHFEKYIAMTENPADRRYAESYLAIARERGAKQ